MARIVVIGAGLGALAGAARLATAGHRVTVYERSETHGGGVRRFEREGFAFDTGPALLHLPAVWRDLFLKTGRESLESAVATRQLDPAALHRFADGTEVTLPISRSGLIGALDSALGAGAGRRWTDLLVRARTAWDATRRPLLEEPLVDAPTPPDPYPALRRRGLLRRRPPTLAEVAAHELGDPRAVALLESCAVGYGLDPRTAPASATVLPYVEHTFGSWYVTGGLRALADAVYRRCGERGVEVVLGTEVTGVVERDGRATGVLLGDGTEVAADSVVDGRCPRTGTAPGRARLTVLLALRGSRPAGVVHRSVVHTADRDAALAALFDAADPLAAPTVTVLRPDDPGAVPDADHEAVTLTATVPPHVAAPGGSGRGPARGRAGARVDWSDAEYTAAAAEQLISAAETVVPGLRDRLLWRAVHTPEDAERETGAPGGAVPVPALAGAPGAGRPAPNLGPVPGRYALGGWAHPGGGLAHAGMSGALVAGLVTEGRDWRGSS
ncbi:NAD(P)/FAD-dependent oxidoreductase [Streptomyces sp. JJ38]|uniref:phytoene desaturase family protein n=1 Tax=Streptomyces sp. JJ38 TaxID=2738128 RepID=UPI001C57CD90|nr:NAD(P)/FAD-dependent oxidoreductase [Streptomyces sp. JJ38]MBW1600204.1 NAD(P)/FAD-dependent oxidoreductase [Streptomyces sp. JJ38]